MKKETLTIDELGMIARGLNAKIRELESSIERSKSDFGIADKGFEKDLQEYKVLQEKLLRMYKFN